MDNKSVERDINLIDLFWEICLKWRSILLCAIIFAVIVGGWKSLKNYNQLSQKQESIKTGDINLAKESLEKINVYFEYKDLLSNQQEYNKKSPLMQLNANGFYNGTVTYFIDNYYQVEYPVILKTDNINGIVGHYRSELSSGAFYDKLSTITGINSNYCADIIKINENINTLTDKSVSYLFEINIYSNDKALCEKILEAVKEEVSNSISSVKEKFGEHSITLISSECKFTSNDDIRVKQLDKINNTNIIFNNLNNIIKTFTSEELTYIEVHDKEIESNNQEEIKDYNESVLSVIEKKYIAFGAFIGVAIIIFYTIFLYLISNKIRITDSIELLFGIKVFGKIPMDNPQKGKIFGFVDKQINKMRYYNKKSFSKEKSLELIIAGIKIAAKKSKISNIFITSSVVNGKQKDVIKTLAQDLKKWEIEIIEGDSILYNAEALEVSTEIGHAILIESVSQSEYQDIAKEIEMCIYQDIKILGAIILY